jgi:cation diffusion facilitator CzcD-associated flavoprotein CzcO
MVSIAIVGAGPYGLSLAAHLRERGIPFRIFGRAMDSWRAHMPTGMMLKSDGFASDIYDPRREFTLERFCYDHGIAYSGTGIPVRLDIFCSYGLAFRDRMVPELDERLVMSIDRVSTGFRLRLDDGETVLSRRVILAVGITHFAYIPTELGHLSSEFLSHSFDHHSLDDFRGRSVVVIGAGASALDLAGLLRENNADVQLVGRRPSLKFHSGPAQGKRSPWQRIRHPQSGLGPGLRSGFFANAPAAFYYLPETVRLHLVRTILGPSGGWFIRDKVMGRVPLFLGYTVQSAIARDGKVHLNLRSAEGQERELVTEHVIAGTGYRPDIERLSLLSPQIRSNIKTVMNTPILSSSFESSVPGLYFVGLAAANSFGPVMRFAFGAGFAARTITARVVRLLPKDSVSVPVTGGIDSPTEPVEVPALRS